MFFSAWVRLDVPEVRGGEVAGEMRGGAVHAVLVPLGAGQWAISIDLTDGDFGDRSFGLAKFTNEPDRVDFGRAMKLAAVHIKGRIADCANVHQSQVMLQGPTWSSEPPV